MSEQKKSLQQKLTRIVICWAELATLDSIVFESDLKHFLIYFNSSGFLHMQ